MKKSTTVTLTILAVVGMAACQRSRRDPCVSATYDDWTCQEAVRNQGYYYHGSWVPMFYPHPYPYYYDSYSQHIRSGGRVIPPAAGAYARPGGASSGVSRGGFGATGSGRAVGA
jgi:hypothetical protein